MCCNFVNTLFSRHASMTGLAIGPIKARDEISEVVVVIVVVIKMRMFRSFEPNF